MGGDLDDFHVRFWLLGAYLVAADDGGCSRENVIFTGTSRQAAR
jgi:hypothetical protein